jgi:hypothetical protein
MPTPEKAIRLSKSHRWQAIHKNHIASRLARGNQNLEDRLKTLTNQKTK